MRVLRRDGSVCDLDEQDILYFTSYKNVITVHTLEEEFVFPTTLDQLLTAYRGLSFEKADRSFIVNMNNVKGFDPVRKSVYFQENPKDPAKYAPVSEPNVNKMLKFLQQRCKPKD